MQGVPKCSSGHQIVVLRFTWPGDEPEKGDRMPDTDSSSFWKEEPTQRNPSLPGSSVHRIKWTFFLCIATSARLRHSCAVLCSLMCRPHEHPFTFLYPVPPSHSAFWKYTLLHFRRRELRPPRLVGVGAKRKRRGAQKCCVNTVVLSV